MRAVLVERYNEIDAITVSDVPVPETPPGAVRVKVRAAGVGFVDGLKIRGLYQTKDPLPFVPGSEFAGTVDEAGEGATRFVPGTPVLGFARSGALADYVVVPEGALHALPEGLSFAVASSFRANYMTALYALSERAYLQAGETLFVLGAAGGVGIAAIQVGKLLGARVIAAASSDAKRAFAKTHGADETIDYTKPNWRDDLKALVGERGVDVVYDPVGSEIGLTAFRTLGWRGRHLVVGFAGGPIPALPFNLPLLKGASLVGVDLAQIGRREPEIEARVQDRLLAWLADGSLAPVVGQTFGIADFREAFRTMTGREAIGKMVIAMD